MSKYKKEFWYPKLVDADYVQGLREDYPEEIEDDWDDDVVRDQFDCTSKYAQLWDNIGDAYDDFEPLADAFLELEKENDKLLKTIERYREAMQDLRDKVATYAGNVAEVHVKDTLMCLLANVDI